MALCGQTSALATGTGVFTEMLGPVGDQTGDIEDRGQDDASKRSAEPVAPAEKDATAEQRQPDSPTANRNHDEKSTAGCASAR